jgi:hypothetical protein
MRLDDGWNQIQFNLSDFTQRAYSTNYVETLRVQVHANCRIRRLYFSDRLYSEEELPVEFKLFYPVQVRLTNVEEGKEGEEECRPGAVSAASPSTHALTRPHSPRLFF